MALRITACIMCLSSKLVAQPDSCSVVCRLPQVSQAKSVLALGACATGIPLCRDREVRLIDGILQKHLREGTGTSLYVSGLPGTGMTACKDNYVLLGTGCF